MKVLWGVAYTSGIAACICLSGCNSLRSAPSQSVPPNVAQRKAAPVIGQPILAGQEGSPHFALELPVTNPGPGKLEAAIAIKGEPSDIQ
jgi:hypothetical protein